MYPCILHATDLSENHYDLCQKATQIAKQFGATLHLLHVIAPTPSMQLAQGLGFAELAEPIKDDAETVMRLLGEALNIPLAQQHVEVGSITAKILETVTRFQCSLILIGSHLPSVLPSFLGSTNYTLLHHAPCDVLTLRTIK